MPKEKNAGAVAMGRKGGQARRRNLTPEQLSAIGRHGAATRYGKSKPPSPPKPARWYGLVLIPEDPNPAKPGDKDYHGNVAAQLKRLDQAHAHPEMLLWSQNRDEVVARKRQEDLHDRWTEILDVDYDPTRFTVQREFKPNVDRQLKALLGLVDAEEGGQS